MYVEHVAVCGRVACRRGEGASSRGACIRGWGQRNAQGMESNTSSCGNLTGVTARG